MNKLFRLKVYNVWINVLKPRLYITTYLRSKYVWNDVSFVFEGLNRQLTFEFAWINKNGKW